MSRLTVKFGLTNPRYVSFADYLVRVFSKSDYLAVKLVERLEIEAGNKSEAVDFVKQTLIDIAAEDLGVNPDKPRQTFRERFYRNGGAA